MNYLVMKLFLRGFRTLETMLHQELQNNSYTMVTQTDRIVITQESTSNHQLQRSQLESGKI
jgi:hypothetical protein